MSFFNINAGKALQGAGQIYAGYAAMDAAYGQAGLYEQEASLMNEQGALTRDDYFRQAALVREDGYRTRAKQTMDYISAGVEAVGTPQLVLQETLSKSTAKAGSLETTGINLKNLYGKKADIQRRTARIKRKEGQAALVSGVLTGAGTIAETVTW